MTCDDVLHLVEAIAADDLEVADAVRAHVETCPRCAASLAAARRVEMLLRERHAPPAPAGFGAGVLSRIRNDRWQVEQRVDRIFNVAIVFAIAIVVGSLAAIGNLSSVLGAASWSWNTAAAASRQIASDAMPMLTTYIAAAALLMSALGMWWWADRRFTL